MFALKTSEFPTDRQGITTDISFFDLAIPWLAIRIDRYADSNEIAEQRLVTGPDYNIVYIFPVAAGSTLGDGYGKHAWRRKVA